MIAFNENLALQARLDRGDEIDLCDAIGLLNIRKSDELWRLADLSARGRLGNPVVPFCEIPISAWPHLRWTMQAGDAVAVTPEGVVIYDIRLRLAASRNGTPSPGDDTSEDRTPRDHPRPQFGDRSAAFMELLEATTLERRPLCLPEYRQMLARFDLSLSEKGRVVGVKLGDRGQIEAAPGSPGIDLDKALMVTRFRTQPERYAAFASRRDMARELLDWVADRHPNVPGVRNAADTDDRKLDKFSSELRNFMATAAPT